MLLPLQQNKSLKELSTFGIGGVARYFVEVESISLLQEVLIYCLEQKLPFHVVGKGSNSLFDDRGFDGVVIHNKIQFFEEANGIVYVGAGYSFSLLGTKTARLGLGGLEFAAGIPASVGGAIFMNAGANGSETADTLLEVTFVDETGKVHLYPKIALTFGYRTSQFQMLKGVIAAAKFSLVPDEKAKERQLEIIEYRKKTQPLKEKSCGCVFRNPPNKSAGALIEACGLKGKKIGGAEVSKVHANFIINTEEGSAQDVLCLADEIKKCVKKQTGVDLEMELRHIQWD